MRKQFYILWVLAVLGFMVASLSAAGNQRIKTFPTTGNGAAFNDSQHENLQLHNYANTQEQEAQETRFRVSEPLPTTIFQNLLAGQKQTVVVYGTSLTYGTGSAHRAAWPFAMKDWFNTNFPGQVTFVNAASSGKDSDWGVKNFSRRVLPHHPDLVFIEFSMNDAVTKFNVSREKSIANLDTMVQALRRQNPHVDIVLLTMNTVWDTPKAPGNTAFSDRPNLDQYYDAYRAYAREHSLTMIDLEPVWKQIQTGDPEKIKRWLPDGTHPIPEGSLAVTWANIRGVLEKARAAAQVPVPPTALTVGEGFVNPIGFHEANPVFSWQLPDNVKRQAAYRIETKAQGKSWDSGWVESDQSTFVPYQGKPFVAREQVEWRVRFRDENGKDSNWSKPAYFEMGLLSRKDWTAQWIRPSQAMPTNGEPVAYLRRTFSIGKKVAKARIYVTARGLFELKLNGVRVGNDYFAPGFTDYDKRIDTLTYDVTGQLRAGDNTVKAMLGTGWYAGRLPFQTKKLGPYGKHPELLFQLEITYADGSRDTIISDGRWQGTFNGPVISSSIYDGESYDARKKPTDWKPVLVNPDLGSERLEPKPFPPVRETQTLAVQNISESQPGHFIFDLGQNMVGWARIHVPVEEGRTVTIHVAEMLKRDGTLYTANYRTAKSTDTYTAAKNGIIEWQPHFTFHGFRYVELTGLPKDAKPQKNWVTGIVLHSDLKEIGKFESSSAKLNQLQSNIVWGWRGNSLDIPTDCPQRDERMGWTGDAEVFCPTAMFNTACQSFWESWLGTMRDDQDADGVIPDIIPDANQKFRSRSPGWMDAATIIPWTVYVRTGDTNVIARNYAMMKKLVGWYHSQSVDGLLSNIKGNGDWLQPYAKGLNGDKRKGDTPLPLIGTAYYARSARILADSARVLGQIDDEKRYTTEADKVKQAFSTHYFDADGNLRNAPETQTAYVLAIAFHLIPKDVAEKAGIHLVHLIHEAGDHLRTGFLGTPWITWALDETGHGDVACDLLFQETYPSWFYPINQGATTMWERWNSYSRDKGFGDAKMNSFNHYAYGAIGQWMYERVAGLAPDPAHPGYKHIFIRPLICKQLNFARAELETPYGKAVSAWAKKGGRVEVDVVVPPNTTATVNLPDGRVLKMIEAGTYHFSSLID